MAVVTTAITFDLPGIPPSANKRMHYMARYHSNQEWKLWASRSLMDAVNRSRIADLPWSRVHVQYIFHYGKTTLVDLDNLIGSCKPILDAAVGVVMPNDDVRYVHEVGARVDIRRGEASGLTVVIAKCGCD